MPDDFDAYFRWLGIPPGERPVDHYRLVGVKRFESNRNVIERAASQRMAHVATHQSGPEAAIAEQLLHELSAARLCLLDPQAKAAYDRQLPGGEAKLASQSGIRPLPVAQPLRAAEPMAAPSATPSQSSAVHTQANVPRVPMGPQTAPSGPQSVPSSPQPTAEPVAESNATPIWKQPIAIAAVVGGAAALVLAFVIVTSVLGGRGRTVVQADQKPESAAPSDGAATSVPPVPQVQSAIPTVVPTTSVGPLNFTNSPADGGANQSSAPAEAESPPAVPATDTVPAVPAADPAASAPNAQPPVAQPPVVQPPVEQPPVVQPPVAQPPVVQPPVTPPTVVPSPNQQPGDAPKVPRSLADLLDEPEPQPSRGNLLGPPIAASVKRLPVPDAAAQKTAREEARRLLKDEFDNSQSPQAKVALSNKLWELARESQDDPSGQYVLLDEAHKLAVDGGHLIQALTMINELESRYEADAWTLRSETLKNMGRFAVTPLDRKQLTEAALELAGGAQAAKRFDVAQTIVSIANAHAQKTGDVKLRNDARLRAIEIEDAKKQWDFVQLAAKRLETEPDNPKANLAYGKFLCLTQRDWDKGLPHLAKSDDATLQATAILDLSQPSEADKQASVADGWWTAAESASGKEKESLLARAHSWYQRTAVKATGLLRVRAEKRMEEIAKQLPAGVLSSAATPAFGAPSFAGRPAAPVPPPQNPASQPQGPSTTPPVTPPVANSGEPNGQLPGVIGRLVVDDRDASVFIQYVTGLNIPNDQFEDMLMKAAVPRGAVRIELFGFISLSAPATVSVQHVGGSANGKHTLYVDGNKVSEVGGGGETDKTIQMMLGDGEHSVRWVITGGEVGTSKIAFFNATTREPLPAYHNNQLLTAARSLPTKYNVLMSN
jgi:hypothetical protein